MGTTAPLMLPLFVCLLVAAAAATDPIVLKPTKTGGEAVGIVMLQGAEIEAKTYVPLFQAAQKASSQEVWVALPSSLGNTVNPMTISGCISDALKSLKSAGFNGTKVFYAGHSLGGAMLELHAFSDHDGVAGLVLMGSFIARKHRGAPGKSFPIPVLTLSGELDGLARVTRNGAEAYQTQIGYASAGAQADAAVKDFPVVVMAGVSHMQYASGVPPTLVKERDLIPEVSYDDAHATMGTHIAAFLSYQTGSSSALSDLAAMKTAVQATGKWCKPIIDALDLEGFHYFKTPCNSDYPTNPTCQYPKWPQKSIGPAKGPPSPMPPSDCTCGSPWVMQSAQKIMAGFELSPDPSVTAVTRDAFHDVSDVRPFHLPHIFNTCKQSSGCVLNTTTVDMPIYEKLDGLDTGFASISAYEQRVKLKSRQAMWQAAGMTADFNVTDAPLKRCAEINQAALDWALKVAGSVTLDRYNKLGNKYVIVDDTYAGIGITGPKWIKMEMIYSQKANTVEISSPTFSTENKNNGDEPFYNTVGYHYCKILSPARIIEWMYVDSLRLRDSLNNKTQSYDVHVV